MIRRIFFCLLTVLFLVQTAFAGGASAAGAFSDTRGHWAQQDIDYLASLGILKGAGKQSFYPDKPITRGEAIALLNRVFESVYGQVAKPVRKPNIDYRYPLRWEIEQLLTNMRTMLQVETGIVDGYDPGDRMLFYLYVAESGQLIRKPQKENPDWWLSSQALQRPLTREEASLILFNLLTPQKFRSANIRPADANAYFTSFYEWKQDTLYEDTYSPYAAAIREFKLFLSTDMFEPDKIVTRAQYAVVLKRLREFFLSDVQGQFRSNAAHQQKMAQVYLYAASLAYESNDKARQSRYFTPSALASMKKLPNVPKAFEHVSIAVKADESDPKNLWAIGQYKRNVNGSYQLEYLFVPDESSTYGRKIATVVFK